jgi:hypothetical protein
MYNNMKWNYSEYKLWIDAGSPINLDVIQLHICDTNIANIDTINNLPMLRELNCSENQILNVAHINLPTLISFNCASNLISDIENVQC